jgi:hypothetical protein
VAQPFSEAEDSADNALQQSLLQGCGVGEEVLYRREDAEQIALDIDVVAEKGFAQGDLATLCDQRVQGSRIRDADGADWRPGV